MTNSTPTAGVAVIPLYRVRTALMLCAWRQRFHRGDAAHLAIAQSEPAR